MWFCLLLFVSLASAASNGLSCSYACDNPTCEPNCRALCDAPVCEVVCVDPAHVRTCSRPSCRTQCPSDQLVTEGCPTCETVCLALECAHEGCTVQCAPTNCNWECMTPTNCPRPQCVLQCEQPACAAPSRSATASRAMASYIVLVFAAAAAMCWII